MRNHWNRLHHLIRLGVLAVTMVSFAEVSFGQVATPAPAPASTPASLPSETEIDPGNSALAIDPAIVIEVAIDLMEKHVAPSVNRKEFLHWKKSMEQAFKNRQNISFLFDGSLMADGRPRAIIIRDFEVVSATVSDRAIELDSLPTGKVRVVPFGVNNLKQAEAYHISKVKFVRSQSKQPWNEIVADIEMQGVRNVRDQIFVRYQFVGSSVGPIYVSPKDLPEPKKSQKIRISSEIDDLVRPKLWGGLCIVDVVQVCGPNPFLDFTSISNQSIEYVELVDPKQADEFVELDFLEAMDEVYGK